MKIVGQSSLSVWSHALATSSAALPVPKARGQRTSTSPLLAALSASSFYPVCCSATPLAVAVAKQYWLAWSGSPKVNCGIRAIIPHLYLRSEGVSSASANILAGPSSGG